MDGIGGPAAGLIDAHAGGVGTLGAPEGKGTASTRMAYVFGTSACSMSSSPEAVRIPGVWGPYYAAMLSDHWLSEGGQSAAGAALDHLVRLHPAYPELAARETDVLGYLTTRAAKTGSASDLARRAAHLTVVPDFNGNRAPLADPSARAIISGLDLSRDEDSLVDLFIAGVIGIACGLRQILEVQGAAGLKSEAVVISGGAGANPVARQILADVTGLDILVPETTEPVLLGAAMLATVASGSKPDLTAAMTGMSGISATFSECAASRAIYDRFYRRYIALQKAAAL
jgi:D-ribulokinase